ncbi:sensor histidine kinase [Bacillus sp. FJAT-49736]|uniref:sensor histidine kinase n=1 Tax=Bacillus sp. FJAT-49736 TaxID=2833582 RepID=UPI001BC8CD18|nr:sensor histidine kinase [Bacillus sp. FJAT-49736]MBS4174461.1 sensor histidine kinase [Bacillus sp. FJAT-49736]MBS4175818.1 sensor histidine kinase [Bacillus sp. FJAT-49736]
MIRIRTKLILYFIILVLLVNGVAFYLYSSSETIMREYDKSFQRFLLLNEISQQTNILVEKMNAYIVEKDPVYLRDFNETNTQLRINKKRLSSEIENKSNYVVLTNYENMLESFLDDSYIAIRAFQDSDINQYSAYFNEATDISGYIQETTMSLINQELTSYQHFYSQMAKRNYYYRITAVLFLSAVFILCTILAIRISGGITNPIKRLSLAAKEISAGHLTGEDIQVTSKDELKLLTETFNQMRKNIIDLVNEIKDKSELDKLLKELELKNLQNQINPHFLFNTLNNIAKMAYLEEAPETTRLIESVSTLLRYNLENIDKPSTLKDEINVVKEYFYIQQTRFGDRITFFTHIDESCMNVPIPRLTLQPIVENAFIHGVESKEEGGTITLSIFKKGEQIFIEVTDDGLGMEEETKARLLNYVNDSEIQSNELHKRSGHSTGIGVINVIKRLQLFYQQKDIVEIESEKGRGTTFRFKIKGV